MTASSSILPGALAGAVGATRVPCDEVSLSSDASGTAVSGAARGESLSTSSEDRDAHVRGPAFFDSGTFPAITFAARDVTGTGQQQWSIARELAIRDRSRPFELIGTAALSAGEMRLRLRGELDRRDFGLTWNRAVAATGVVSTTVHLELDLTLVRALEPSA